MDVGPFFVTKPQATELAEPGQRELHYRAEASQTSVLLPSMGDERADTPLAEPPADLGRIVGLVRLEEAKEPLRTVLVAGAERAKTVFAEAEALGIRERTLKRAKADLGVKTMKGSNGWLWSLAKNEEEVER